MVAVFTSVVLLLASAAGSDTTCDTTVMLQHPSVSTVLQRELPKADGSKRSVDTLSRAKPVSLLETDSSVATEEDSSFVNFHNPRVWGPAGWFFFHSIALAQPDNIDAAQQERLRRFFTEDMPHILPCPQCGRNAQEHIYDMTIDDTTFASRDSVARFVWDLHDDVNAEKAARNETLSRISYERSVLNYAGAYEQEQTLLHFDNPAAETAAVSLTERHKVDLLMSPAPTAQPSVELLMDKAPVPQPSMFTELFSFVSSYWAQGITDGPGI